MTTLLEAVSGVVKIRLKFSLKITKQKGAEIDTGAHANKTRQEESRGETSGQYDEDRCADEGRLGRWVW